MDTGYAAFLRDACTGMHRTGEQGAMGRRPPPRPPDSALRGSLLQLAWLVAVAAVSSRSQCP